MTRFASRSGPHSRRRILTARFLKFGVVGASGTLVNLGVLFLGQEYFFTFIHQVYLRLNVSLALAICLATVNNFLWNRTWTWLDRKQQFGKSVFVQFSQYALACWFSIGMQFVVTNVLSVYLTYLIANVIAISLASIVSFVANDWWTFARGGVLLPHLNKQAKRPNIST